MPKLKISGLSSDDIPEGLKDYFIESADGAFELDAENIDGHSRVRGVVTANRENVKKRDAYKKQVDELTAKVAVLPDDFDPEEYATLKAGGNGKPNEAIEALKQQNARAIEALKTKYAQELAAKDGEVSERDGYIDRTLVDSGLRTALLDAGVKPGLLDGAVAALRGGVKVQRSDNGDRKAIIETDLGEVDIPAFVKDWSATKGKDYLAPATGPKPLGGGRGGNGDKTITRAEFDAMPQFDRATKMKEGFKVVDAS